MDFYQIRTKQLKSGTTELYPGFTVGRSTDLMVRSGNFYAIWDEKQGVWSTDEYDVARLMDEELREHAQKLKDKGSVCTVKDLRSFESNSWSIFQRFISQVGDSSYPLDQNLTFVLAKVRF